MPKYRYKKYYRKRKRKSPFKSGYFWLVFLFLFLLAGIFYFLLFHPVFFVKNIKVSPDENKIKSLAEDFCDKKILNLSSKSYFLIKSQDLKEKILEFFPEIERVSVKKSFPSSLKIEAVKREPKIVWRERDYFFNIDKHGIAFETAEKKEPFFYFQTPKEKSMFGEKIIEPELVALLLKLGSNFEAKEFEIGKKLQRVNMEHREGWKAYFSLNEDMEEQISNLILILEEHIEQGARHNLEYIDLRFKNRVYYKFKK